LEAAIDEAALPLMLAFQASLEFGRYSFEIGST